MKKFTFTLALSVLTLTVACQTPPTTVDDATPASGSAEEVRAIIEAANAEISTLLEAGEYDQAGTFFAEDVIQVIAGQSPITGRAEWIAAQRGAAELGDWDLQLELLELEVSGNIAVERGRGIQTFIAAEESPMASFEMTGDYIVLWKKIGGRWQIQWDYVVTQPASAG